MRLVNAWDQQGRRQDDEQQVPQQKVGTPQVEFDGLHDEFSCRLGENGRSESSSVPLAGPPSSVGLVVLELTSQHDRDEDLVQRALNTDDGDKAKHCS